MFDFDRWGEIWASIRANKLRTFLSGVTIALALFVFITLFGLSKGLQNGFEREFFPPNVKAVHISGGKANLAFKGRMSDRLVELKIDDYELLKKETADRAAMVLPRLERMISARNFSEYGSYTLIGSIPEEKDYREFEILKGRFLDEFDGEDIEKNIVIGRMVEKDLFKTGSALGQPIQLGKTMFRVVGVYSDKKDEGDNERLILLPLKTAEVVFGTDVLSGMVVVPEESLPLSAISEMADEIRKLLKAKHDIHPDDTGGIRVYDPSEGLETTNLFFLVFTLIVLIIGIGSLVAGIVSIGNMMVFSVKERTKEIGIRKALGAKPSNIIGLIMQEAILITFLFGAIGIVVAVLLTNAIQDSLVDYLIYDPRVEPIRIVMAALVLFFAGIMAGFIPARRASKIKPIEALNEGK
ncbi:MAG: ABC transporter permease [Flavobacteriaceae bacterium]|nr:ABC transporter permease [Flavobacteriaceae bacterium]